MTTDTHPGSAAATILPAPDKYIRDSELQEKYYDFYKDSINQSLLSLRQNSSDPSKLHEDIQTLQNSFAWRSMREEDLKFHGFHVEGQFGKDPQYVMPLRTIPMGERLNSWIKDDTGAFTGKAALATGAGLGVSALLHSVSTVALVGGFAAFGSSLFLAGAVLAGVATVASLGWLAQAMYKNRVGLFSDPQDHFDNLKLSARRYRSTVKPGDTSERTEPRLSLEGLEDSDKGVLLYGNYLLDKFNFFKENASRMGEDAIQSQAWDLNKSWQRKSFNSYNSAKEQPRLIRTEAGFENIDGEKILPLRARKLGTRIAASTGDFLIGTLAATFGAVASAGLAVFGAAAAVHGFNAPLGPNLASIFSHVLIPLAIAPMAGYLSIQSAKGAFWGVTQPLVDSFKTFGKNAIGLEDYSVTAYRDKDIRKKTKTRTISKPPANAAQWAARPPLLDTIM